MRQHEFKVPHVRKVWRSAVKAVIWTLWVLCLLPMELSAWTNGRLLVWMDSERAQGAMAIAEKFENDFRNRGHDRNTGKYN